MATPDTRRDDKRDVPRDETSDLISSDKVEGTAVYGADGKKIGRVETLMLDKRSGRVAYAVLSFGGFLGLGEDHYPVPWSMLTYNENLGGYQVTITKEQLRDAPRYSDDQRDWDNYESGRIVYEYYGQAPYWM